MTSTSRSGDDVQKIRSWTGLLVVVFGDVAIAVAAIFGIVAASRDGSAAGGANGENSQIVAILTSAFTAVGTMTTAYFGIRAMSNTAQSSMADGHVKDDTVQVPPGGNVQV